ncbi:SpoIIE family protein phosphatase [Myceligenerans xiligouense]|uniref:Serine phosphatase RsbU (Regulator of sigma subunit) n=1 Tax=Myceligenerans xiligouense TaxID=253184 RepID=A0A3N4ZBN9_9MICO|nr:SpoIIE family protein phosphatase [Myceligenerans xiligouense]RPF23298.1 serine phosphatase RsbU (regulator of sigma subunit) [Myceligenerans xiligouense]
MPTDLQALNDLAHVGLGTPAADEAFERFARLVRRHLAVPAAAVVILSDDGTPAAGHGHERSGTAASPPDDELLHLRTGLARPVVEADKPLVIEDVRDDRTFGAGPVVRNLGVVAYAGFPVHDLRGRPIGALVAVDDRPRRWSPEALATLEDLAAACSAESRLQAERERARRVQHAAVRANRRSRFLLSLSEAFAGAQSVNDIDAVIADIGTTGIGARYCGLALVDTDRRGITYTSLAHVEPGFPASFRHARLTEDRPVCEVVRTGKPLFYASDNELITAFPEVAQYSNHGLGARAFLPVLSPSGTAFGIRPGGVVGVVVFVWEREARNDQDLFALGAALAQYAGDALERAWLLDERRRAATTLQRSMLSRLPQIAHLDLACTYSPATRSDQVGGDWYDAVPLDDEASIFMVGDVTGHDMRAAATMGQLRSLLRALAWSHDAAPSELLRLLDKANDGLGLRASGTAVLVRLDRVKHGGGTYEVTWSSAGHPPPLVLRQDGSVDRLDARGDMMLGVVPGIRRTDHATLLRPGETLLLYTDGLTEQHSASEDEALSGLEKTLASLADTATAALPITLVRRLIGQDQHDDVAVLAVRVRRATMPSNRSEPGTARVERKVADDLSDLAPARLWIDDMLETCGVPLAQRRTITLLASEILTNALDHGRAPISTVLDIDPARVRVGVRDGSPVRPRMKDPDVREFGGRGIQLLERLASRWGVDRHVDDDDTGLDEATRGASRDRGRGKTVWFEIDREP